MFTGIRGKTNKNWLVALIAKLNLRNKKKKEKKYLKSNEIQIRIMRNRITIIGRNGNLRLERTSFLSGGENSRLFPFCL